MSPEVAVGKSEIQPEGLSEFMLCGIYQAEEQGGRVSAGAAF